jgi:hypothetical protein
MTTKTDEQMTRVVAGAAQRGKTTTQTPESGERIPSPPKTRRRPILIALCILFVTVGALLAGWLTTVVGHTQPVVAVRVTVARGETITQNDLVVVSISPDPSLKTVPGADLPSLVGQRAAFDLPAGGLVTNNSVTNASIPAAGQSLVGVSLTPAQLPAQPLRSGDKVRVVTTPRQQDDPPSSVPPAVSATVVSTRSVGDNGQVVVDVTVPAVDAATLAATAATGRVALILDGGAH